MARNSWLEEDLNDAPALDPWAAAPQQTPEMAPQASAPPPTSGDPASSWMPPAAAPQTPAQTGTAGDYSQDVGVRSADPSQLQSGGQGGGVTAGTSAADTARYGTQLEAVKNATDPASKAIAQDALARQVQKDLEADGHKVTWKGDVLMVDGRAYELGGEPVSSSGGYTGAKDVESLIQHYQSQNPVAGGVDGLIQFLQQNGVNAKRATHSGMQSNDAIDIDGKIYDEIFNVGGADQHWQHIQPGDGGDPLSALSGSRGGSWLDGGGGFLGSFQKVFDMASAPNAGDAQMEEYVRNLLQNPESLSERDVETLKAKSAEEAAAAAQLQDEELQHFGFGAGLDSSPWLAGQRTQNEWSRRGATIESNRNVDIAAADRRGADRRAAAGVGQAWANLKASQKSQALSSAVSYLNTELGYNIDLQTLAQRDEQFKADLMQRIAALKQADEQFRANYGLDVQKFDHTKDQDMWQRGRDTNTGTIGG